MRKTCPATSQEAWPEAESLAMKDSLGRESRWNADRCAPGNPGAAVAESHGRIPIASVGVSPPTFSFVLCFRHPCRSGACTCFHRHFAAAAQHEPPNQVG